MKQDMRQKMGYVSAMGDKDREQWLMDNQSTLDFNAAYTAIEQLKATAIANKKGDRYLELMHFKAHVEMWDPQYH